MKGKGWNVKRESLEIEGVIQEKIQVKKGEEKGEKVKGWRTRRGKRWRWEQTKRWWGEGVKGWRWGWEQAEVMGLRGKGMKGGGARAAIYYCWGEGVSPCIRRRRRRRRRGAIHSFLSCRRIRTGREKYVLWSMGRETRLLSTGATGMYRKPMIELCSRREG